MTRLLIWLRLNVWRSHYRCRCGAILANHYRAQHEEFHDAAREFFQPPTMEQLRAAGLLKEPR